MKTILVIDDLQSILITTSKILTNQGYEVSTAENGENGIILAKTIIPDLILCDVIMPGKDGFKVLEELKSDETTKYIPFVFLTARVEKFDMRRGMELGADDYLTKPFTVQELINAVETQKNKKQSQKQYIDREFEQLRSNISQSIPHEVFTPLNSILGFSKILIDKAYALSPEKIKSIAENINQSGDRLLHTLRNFVFYSNLEIIKSSNEKGKEFVKENVTNFNISTYEQYCKLIISKQNRLLDLSIDFHDSPKIKISESNLLKIFEEILLNAAKFSTYGTEIKLRAKSGQHYFAIECHNYGIGMTREQIDLIGAYSQFDRERQSQQGNGLGLAIVKQILNLIEGKLEVNSIPGTDITFRVKIPIIV